MPPTPPPFQSLRYDGARFARHSLPVDVLPDLLAYRDLLIEVAKELFRHAHDRKRVPKGFDEHLRLDLVNIKEGCAIAQLENRAVVVHEGDDETSVYFDQARDLISACVEAAAAGRELPPTFPERLLPYFNGIGRNLQPDEVIEMGYGRDPSPARYSGEVRSRLVLHVTKQIEQAVDLVGLVTEFYGTGYVPLFTLQVPGKPSVQAPYHDAIQEVLFDAYRHREEQWQVRVTGVGVYNQHGLLQKILSTTHVELAEAPEILTMRSRLSAMAQLPVGWFEPQSPAPSSSVVALATTFLVRLFDAHDVPAPQVYPRPGGGIQAEWDSEAFTVEARFSADGRVVRLSADPKDEGESADEEFALSAAESTAKAATWLLRYLSRNA